MSGSILQDYAFNPVFYDIARTGRKLWVSIYFQVPEKLIRVHEIHEASRELNARLAQEFQIYPVNLCWMTHGTKRDKTQKNFLLLFNSFQLLIRSNSVGVQSRTHFRRIFTTMCPQFLHSHTLTSLLANTSASSIFLRSARYLSSWRFSIAATRRNFSASSEILLPLPSWQSLHTYPSTHSFLLRQQLSNSQLYH